MTGVRLDHFITYANAADIDDYIEAYAAQGFVPLDRTVRHHPGLRNGFVRIGPEYLEFCWVEDEAQFAEAEEEEKLLRAAPRPFGLGMVADDVQAVHDDWVARGYSVPEVSSSAPRDAPADAPPSWSFQTIPTELLPGAWCFALTYHLRPKDEPTSIMVGPNTVYAVSGVTFVASDPESRATAWRDLLVPGETVEASSAGFLVRIGPHRVMWVTAKQYQATYGLSWTPFSHPIGEIALLHLLASDLGVAQATVERAGRRVSPASVGGEDVLLIAPDLRDGFTFLVRQQPIGNWLQERQDRTGEDLQVIQE